MSNPTGLQLVWNGKDKIINHHNEIPFRILNEIKSKSFKQDDKNSTENIIIRGDNLDGLKALKPYFYNSVKIIYIDPPYNTGQKQGSRGWVYSDRVDNPIMKKWFNKVVGAENEDYSRHTKWLCMMYPRLKLLYELLRENGIIFVSIDDNEVHNLRLLLDEIFGSGNFIAQLVWKKKAGGGSDTKYFAIDHEYVLVYAKNENFQERYFVGLTQKLKEQYKYKDENYDGLGPYKRKNLYQVGIETDRPNLKYAIECPDGTKVMPPTIWRWSKETFSKAKKEGKIDFVKNREGQWQIFTKMYLYDIDGEEYEIKPRSILVDMGMTKDGNKELKQIFGENNKTFDYPKPTSLIKYLIGIISKKDDIVLDSFAGSGTTGQAVLELNKGDKGNRKFILIQLDEGFEGEKVNICDTVTAERIRRVIKGYSYKDDKGKSGKVAGLGGGFKYYEVNGTLKDEKGFINSLLTKEDIAKFIIFSETKETLAKLDRFNGDFKIGEKNNVVFYFIHDKKILLDNKFLEKIEYEKLKKEGRFVVIYAYGTILDDAYLEENRENLRFMHIPNDLDKIAKI